MTNVEGLIREGIAAYRAGRRDEARTLLNRATELDSHNAEAWLWLSAVVDNVEGQQLCLENVLAIDPQNRRALQGLEKIRKLLASRKPPVSPAAPSPQQPAGAAPFDMNAPAPSVDDPSYHDIVWQGGGALPHRWRRQVGFMAAGSRSICLRQMNMTPGLMA